MSMHTNQLVKEWNEIIKEVAQRPHELELTGYMGRLSIDIFMRVGFAMDCKKGGTEIYGDIKGLEDIMNQNYHYRWLPDTRYTIITR